MAKIFKHKRETWDAAKCAKVARHRERNGYGDLHPYPGLVSPTGSARPHYGDTVFYNGGCVRNGKWYEGEHIPMPKIPKEYEFFYRLSWGTYIREKKKKFPK